MEKFYRKHPEKRPPPENLSNDEDEPESAKNEPRIREEQYKYWDRKKGLIVDIIDQPPDEPVRENRPNRDTMHVTGGVSYIEPRVDHDGRLLRDDKGAFVMDVVEGAPDSSHKNRMRRDELTKLQSSHFHSNQQSL